MGDAKERAFLPRVLRGSRSYLRGLRLAAKDKEVRIAYLWLALILLAATLVLDVAGLLLLFHLTPLAPEASLSVAIGVWLLRALIALMILFLAPLLAIILCNICAPVFSELPFLAGMKTIRPRLAARLASQDGLTLRSAIGVSLYRMGTLIGVSLISMLLGMVPVLGTIVGAGLQLFFGARMVGWELLDPYLDKRGEGLKLQKSTLQKFHPEILGMGLVATPVFAIPLLGPLFFGLLQAAAANFVVECIEGSSPDEHDFPTIAP